MLLALIQEISLKIIGFVNNLPSKNTDQTRFSKLQALYNAILNSNKKQVEMLLSKKNQLRHEITTFKELGYQVDKVLGSFPYEYSLTPLFVAVYKQDITILHLLLSSKLDFDWANNLPQTDPALHFAIQNKLEGVINVFLPYLTISDFKRNYSFGKTTILMEAISFCDNTDIVSKLLDTLSELADRNTFKTILETKNNNRETALHCAILNGSKSTIDLLISKGANNSKDFDDNTLVRKAIIHKDTTRKKKISDLSAKNSTQSDSDPTPRDDLIRREANCNGNTKKNFIYPVLGLGILGAVILWFFKKNLLKDLFYTPSKSNESFINPINLAASHSRSRER